MNTGALVALAVAALIAGLGALVVAFVLRKRLRVPLVIFVVAAGFYVLNLIVQQPIFLGIRATTHATGLLMTGLIAPAVYAVCEEVLRFFSFRVGKSMRGNRTPNGAIMAGLGHGGAESMFFTLAMIASVATAVFAPRAFIANGGDPNTILHGGPGYY
ncbi:YhfC family glutamic-type intramembrane protease, partial [Fodinicola feengrottensis]